VHITWNLPGKEVMLSPLAYKRGQMVIVEEPTFYDIKPYERMLNDDPLEIHPFKGSADMDGYQAAFSVIVNKDSPLESLSMKQLDGIFGCARNGGWVGTAFLPSHARGKEEDIRTWGEVGLTGDFADAKIEAHTYSSPSAIGQTLSDMICGGSDYWVEGLHCYGSYYKDDGTAYFADEQICDAVAADKFAIGIVSGQKFVSDDVKVLSIAPGDTTDAVACTPENIYNGTYPLLRKGELFITVVGKLNAKEAAFLRYILSEEGQKAVAEDGKFVPLTPDECKEQLALVNAACEAKSTGEETVSDEDKAAALANQQAHFKVVRSRAERVEYSMDTFDISALPHYVPETYPEGYMRVYGNSHTEVSMQKEIWTEGFEAFQPNIHIAWELPTGSMGYSGLYLDMFDLFLCQRRTPEDAIAYQKIVGEDLWGVTAYTGAYKLGGWGNTLCVMVNEDNPIESISVEQLDGIFGSARSGGWDKFGYWYPNLSRGADKNIRTWGDLGLTGEWKDKLILPQTFQLRYDTAREVSESLLDGSGQWSENVMSTGNYVTETGERITGADWIPKNIIADDRGLGFCRYTDDYMLPGIKFVPVSKDGGDPVYPDFKTTQSMEYPFVFTQEFWYKVEKGVPMNPMVYEFLKYILSYEGQEAVMKDGKYQPLTAEMCNAMREKLEAVRYGY